MEKIENVKKRVKVEAKTTRKRLAKFAQRLVGPASPDSSCCNSCYDTSIDAKEK